MNSRSVAPIACAVAALVTTGAERAHALSCALTEVIVPFPDSVQVPTNTLVWCTKGANAPSAPIRLMDSAGADVSGTETQMSMPGYDILVFHPDSELAPNSQYTVDCPLRYTDTDQPGVVFTTGAGARTTPPAVPNVSNIEVVARADDGWGASYFAMFREAGAAETIVVVDLPARGTTLNPDGPSGSVSEAEYYLRASDIFVGTGPCGGNWPGAKLGASTTVALGAFDQTGAFSGWSEPVRLTIPNEHTVAGEGEAAANDDGEPEGSGELDDDGELTGNGSSRPTNGSATDQVDLADEFVATNTDDDLPAPDRPSPMGRSGCALGVGGSSAGVAAGLLLAIAGFAARRRRSA